MPDHLLPLMNTEVVADVVCVCDSILYKVLKQTDICMNAFISSLKHEGVFKQTGQDINID